MKFLVTGGAGFIGSHLSEYLLPHNDVEIIDDLSTGRQKNIEHLLSQKNFSFINASILNRVVLEPLIKNCDIIFHLAAAVGVDYIIKNPDKIREVNIKGSEIVFELAIKHKKGIFFSSSSEVYNSSFKGSLIENSPECLDGPISIYGSSKRETEKLAEYYSKTNKLCCCIARLFNVIGPRQCADYGMVVPRFIKQALSEQPITIYGDGKQKRSFIDVRDVVTAIALLVKSKKSFGRIVNIGEEQDISIIDLAEIIKKLTKSKSKILFIPYKNTLRKNYMNSIYRKPHIKNLQNLISWVPLHTLQSSISAAINYIKN